MTTPEGSITAPLPRLFRILLRLNRILVRTGVVTPIARIGSVPVAKRLAIKPPSWSLPKPSGAVAIEEPVAQGRHGDVPLRTYRPASGGVAPTAVLFVHGGGFTTGGLDALDWFCRELAARGRLAVVSVQYRLAPEHPFPVPLDDVQDALRWLEAHLESLGAERIAVAGDSAGGNLAAAVCIRSRDEGGPAVAQQILIYPALDATHSSPSTADTGASLSSADIVTSFGHYRGARPADDPEISPLLAADLSRLPDALVLIADHDILRDEGRRYAEALTAAGIAARTVEYPGTDHAFLSLPLVFTAASQAAVDEVLATLASTATL